MPRKYKYKCNINVFKCIFLSSMFFFSLLLCQTIFRWLASFLRFFLFLKRKGRKNQVQIVVFNKKAVVKISTIANSKSPP